MWTTPPKILKCIKTEGFVSYWKHWYYCGFEKSIEQDREEGQIEDAKMMLEDGVPYSRVPYSNVPYSKISKYTGLSVEDIEGIKETK